MQQMHSGSDQYHSIICLRFRSISLYNMFNKWRKCNLGTRTGNDLLEELEKRVNIYIEEHKECGGRALLKRFCKGKSGSCDQPLI